MSRRVGVVVDLSEEIIGVKVDEKLLHAGPEFIAGLSGHIRLENTVAVEVAVVGLEFVHEFGRNDIHPEKCFGDDGVGVNVPVGDTIAHNETLKVDLFNLRVNH